MNYTYGAHTGAVGEAGIVFERLPQFNEADEPIGLLHRWTINGMIVAGNLSALSTASTALQNAFATHGGNLNLSGGNMSLTSASCIGGTRVMSFSWNDTEPAAYTLWRKYTAVVEGFVPVTGSTSLLIAFAESLSFTGGGPMDGHLEPLQGKPIKQRWKNNTVCRVVQAGRAIGFRGYPQFPAPIWPAAEIQALRERVYENPKRHKSGSTAAFTHYPINWSYRFEDRDALSGTPNRWGSM